MAEDQKPDEKPDTDDQRVPRTRLNDEIEKRKAAEKRASEMEDRIEALESRDKTDVERLTKDLEKATAKADAFEQKYNGEVEARQVDQRSAWVQAAAAKANFHDPAVAARMADLGDIEDAAGAEKAVKQLAKDNGWLVKTDSSGGKLERVGKDGDVVKPKPNADGKVPAEQLERSWGEEMLSGLTGQQKQRAAAGAGVTDKAGETWEQAGDE